MTEPMRNEQIVEDDEINLLELLQVLVRRKRLIVVMCAVAALLSVAYSLTLPNIYTATARVLPPQKDGGGGLSALVGQAGALAGLAGVGGLGGGADLYVGILKSRSVADAVIKKLDLQKELKTNSSDESRMALQSLVKIQAGKDGIITVAADSRNPQLAARLANTFVDELGKKSVELNLTKAGTERIFLEKRLDVVKADLKKAEESLRGFQEKNRAFKVDDQATATIEGAAKLKAEIVSKEVQLASLRSYQTNENPEVKAVEAALAKLRGQLGVLTGGGRSSDLMLSAGTMPSLGLEYVRLMREVKTQEAIFEQLTKQYEVAKLGEAKDSSSIQVLDEAVAPQNKSKPKRSLIVILSTVTAFFLGIFIAFIQEYAQKMSDEDRTRWNEIRESLSLSRARRG
ncbi:lipopolysaccharide biosynthesis protein [Geobacter hydrogenophilus]|uniref:Polysaccharide chain length determinant protein n=2 Tax=Geobacter hydrogenophilus TaxID=40983 RepID=A0A9W6L9Q1_9BACT|nr:Wzz/FepE/Etk N-terminal domain-containing protein [Geobacter hydrogenophilus]MBT0895161.1 lipopolysaccharide biosynthesis protein [Geobacter hydrogenophilus]GLI36657.1 polysaccharide chain length determinant protein [Geobacter hydrogenophilus]